jgi:protocatechuate 3,4-dioxygenase beta subunit
MRKKENGQIPLLLLVIGLLIVAVAAVFLLDTDSTDGPAIDPIVSEETDVETPLLADAGPDPIRTEAENSGQGARTEVSETGSRAKGPTGAAVYGTVINKTNLPIPGATVVLTERSASSNPFAEAQELMAESRSARTDAEGVYRFQRLPANIEYEMWVYHPEYAPTKGISLRALANEEQQMNPVVLGVGYRIHGVAMDSGNNPLQGVEVVARLHAVVNFGSDDQDFLAREEELGKLRRTTTDDYGQYAFEHLAQGIYQLEASLTDFATAIDNAVQCMGSEMEVQRDLVLGTEHRLAGLVRDEAGNPVPGAKVAAARTRPRPIYQATTTADENGIFELRSLPEGGYGISVLADGYAPARMSHVNSGRTDLEFVLRQKGGVRGRITGPEDQPITSFSLELMRVNQGTAQFGVTNRRRQVEDPDGQYLFPDLDRGTYVLLVRAEGYAPTYTGGFYVERSMVENIDLVLQSGGVLVGKVLDPDGNSLAGAKVTLRGRDYNEWHQNSLFGTAIGDPNNVPATSTTSDAQGNFTLKEAFPGQHQLEVSHRNFLTVNAGIYVQAERRTQVGEIQLERGGAVLGTVRTKAGEYAAGASVYLTLKESESGFFNRKALADAKGRFRFDGLRPGLYQVSAVRDDSSAFFFPGATPGSSEDIFLKLGSSETVQLVVPNQ